MRYSQNDDAKHNDTDAIKQKAKLQELRLQSV